MKEYLYGEKCACNREIKENLRQINKVHVYGAQKWIF
jgi:hypothetical protein